ncbi:MAG: ATP-binding protein [Gammaproteobacteria bacterium]
MATADQLKALIRSHLEGDDSRFNAIALQLAAHAARTGKAKLAQELKALIDEMRSRAEVVPVAPRIKPTPLAQPRGELAGILSVSYSRTRLREMVLDDSIRHLLERVLTEQRQRHRIHEHGLFPIRKVLLTGPPGTGKTLTASVLAAELTLPLFTIQLDGLITKFMGETAAKLRLVFDAIHQTRGVYLFDEFDAVGGHRTSKNDVGEIRRVLNSFLQFLENDSSDSIVIAATNHPSMLDSALFRRFDLVVAYQLPTPSMAAEVLQNRLAAFDTKSVDWDDMARCSPGLNHGDLVRAAEQAAKNAILDEKSSITSAMLSEALRERQIDHKD